MTSFIKQTIGFRKGDSICQPLCMDCRLWQSSEHFGARVRKSQRTSNAWWEYFNWRLIARFLGYLFTWRREIHWGTSLPVVLLVDADHSLRVFNRNQFMIHRRLVARFLVYLFAWRREIHWGTSLPLVLLIDAEHVSCKFSRNRVFGTEDSSLAFLAIFSWVRRKVPRLSVRDHLSCHAGLVNCTGLPLGREDFCTDPVGYQNPDLR